MHKPVDDNISPPTSATTDKGCLCSCKAPAPAGQDEVPDTDLATVLLGIHYDIGKDPAAK